MVFMQALIISFAPTSSDLDELSSWLKKEADTNGQGFYCNWNLIDAAFWKRRLGIIAKGKDVVGFVVWYQDGKYARIDITEIKPRNRRKGIGRTLINALIKRLIADGVAVVELNCQPASSEAFWKTMGFIRFPSHHLFADRHLRDDPHLYRPLEPSLPLNLTHGHEAEHLLELRPDDSPFSSQEGNWAWILEIEEETGRLLAPVIFPAFQDWKLRYQRDGKTIIEEKVKWFPKDILDNGFIVLREIVLS